MCQVCVSDYAIELRHGMPRVRIAAALVANTIKDTYRHHHITHTHKKHSRERKGESAKHTKGKKKEKERETTTSLLSSFSLSLSLSLSSCPISLIIGMFSASRSIRVS